ncbi:UDP-N-acetylmuramoylalanyl-D-glutamate--2,6-diaminopimelate ligase [Sulfurivirga caldicuralii]|uniref:UDP-N-acetylmuramoyl-L-alanyl-D-glutamate--2,6-diaminopimelate ligase n=1 Tax=Sulfurivirga caldicuralii TaxID=364032 RepID=A0A1N6DVE2_9GAMM|nr:UDP-N-acetylmuramoyl-L-alanyl-D-glutamate--2,6-diaminopimelate ligase [Sulfurivirga caldicuralii]SIN74768.1 UDP-N-acetylmuramoylalanyl-D-glutamate--2,6-diaminopimelate ligase [Sulfurivirga caldicuralii]
MRTLAELAAWWGLDTDASGSVSRVVADSREVRAGDLFLALPGAHVHGSRFAQQALQAGAVAVLSDRPVPGQDRVLVVPDLAARLAEFVRWFYSAPDARLKVVGVTGTNGKSSTVWYAAQMLTALDHRVGVIGTLGYGLWPRLQAGANTTPDVVRLYGLLHDFLEAGVDTVLMEVSSHAIAMGRIDGLQFEGVALTQMTRDHLDFHGTLEAYHATKARLFIDWPSCWQVLNVDDAQGAALVQKVAHPVTYGHHAADWRCNALSAGQTGLSGRVAHKNKVFACKTSLYGRYNAENMLCASAIVEKVGDPPVGRWETLWQMLEPVEGRMERIADKPNVFIDYAHTPDALEAVLNSLREHFPERTLWVVFGAGGGRDQGKRPLMGAVADRLADRIILTSDNPRCEDPEQIIHEIAAGIKTHSYKTFPNRARAIQTALQCAGPDDVVLIAGKGHESWQEFCGERVPFSDKDEALKWVKG